MALMYRSVHEPPNLAAVPAGLRTVVAACLHKDPAARPAPGALLDLVTGPAHSTPAGYTPTLAVPPPAFPPPASAPTRPATPPPFPPPAVFPPPAGFAPPAHLQPLVIGDRSASITVDTTGVTLQVDTVEADFDWPEIAAVICTPTRRGRFTVTVRLHDGMSYPCELDAQRADRRDAWISQLNALVGRHLGR